MIFIWVHTYKRIIFLYNIANIIRTARDPLFRSIDLSIFYVYCEKTTKYVHYKIARYINPFKKYYQTFFSIEIHDLHRNPLFKIDLL